jgi:uncharacterized protein (TIGR03437 family)
VAQIPSAILAGNASVVVVSAGAPSAPATISVQASAPFILTYAANHAVVQNQDYSLNSATNPTSPGTAAVAYLIGSGPVSPAIDDGAAASSLPPSTEILSTSVTLGGMPAKVLFAGMAPGFVGLVQLNFEVPTLAPGEYPIQVTIGKVQSNTPVLNVGN